MKLNGYNIIAGLLVVVSASSCVKDENSPGYEYMPDMYRSPAIEAYVDYGEVRTWVPNDSLKNRLTALRPPVGTVHYQGTDEVYLPYNRLPSKELVTGNGVISAATSETDYAESANDKNPLVFDLQNAKKGEVLYGRFCVHCHGVEGKGDGKVAGPLGAKPADLSVKRADGQMFYSITYGKGVMGPHASQLNKKERWELITYLNVLSNDGTFPEASVSVEDELKDLAAHKNDEGDHTLALKNLEFTTGSAELKPSSAATLKALYDFMIYNDYKVEIAGHTDNAGDKDANKQLSQARAESVKSYLIRKGIDASRLMAVGYGQTKPKATNDTEEGKAQNRRTEIILK